ncbi:MAG: MBOAT family O-acyltransferase [Anaerolineales bacterium]|jgi:D-alanyl-lipoteichoic acid acyltransferase DltB (MBOAT superfamily)
MSFTSFQFIGCLLIALFIWLYLPGRWQWKFLLLASALYYISWKPEYVLVILAIVLVSFYTAILLEKEQRNPFRKLYLILGLVLTISPLFFFKYFNFFLRSGAKFLALFGTDIPYPILDWIAPIGVSFYTLQVVSYILDVYRRVQRPEKHFGKYALFVSFFPQIVAGPIPRAKDLLPQFNRIHKFDSQRIIQGARRVLWGLFQKIVIADQLANVVNKVYDNYSEYQGLALLLATYIFAFQIYYDFAGYTSIAIGIAKALGIDLRENFDYPYIAKDPIEFWNRWHITFSTWLRDYIFYPLVRFLRRWKISNTSFFGLLIPPLLTMLVSGIWHGAGWNFVIWGALHGLYLILANLTRTLRRQIFNPEKWGKYISVEYLVQQFITFNLVAFAWIFFRANNYLDAANIIHQILTDKLNLQAMDRLDLTIALAMILFILIVEYIQRRGIGSLWLDSIHVILRWSLYYLAIFAILFFGSFGAQWEFIYARF